MATELLERVERHIVEYEPHSDSHIIVGCIDDRPAVAHCTVLGQAWKNRVGYVQTPGAGMGYTTDELVAIEMEQPNLVVGQGINVARMTTINHDHLLAHGILLTVHGGCASNKTANSTAKNMALGVDLDGLYRGTLLFNPDVDERMFQRVVDANYRLYHAGLIPEDHEAKEVMGLHPGQEPKVPHAELTAEDHAGEIMISDLKGGVLDVPSAWSDGVPAYLVAFGAMRQHVMEKSRLLTGYNLEFALASMAVRAASLRMGALANADGSYLDVVLRGGR